MSEWSAPEFESKICPPEKLAERLAALPRPLVFTNGCFDILHRGHVTYLAQARSAGAALVLALNTDASVRRQGKGDDRPINPLETARQWQRHWPAWIWSHGLMTTRRPR